MIALLATGAAMADTVPPSIVLIVLGSVAGVSIAGRSPPVSSLPWFCSRPRYSCALESTRRGDGRHSEGTLRAVGKALVIAAPALVLPFLIRSAVGGGVATATEVSTIAVLYAMIIGMVLYGGIRPGKIYDMLVETAALSGAILIILGTASAMAWALTQTGFAFKMAALVTDLPGGWITYMLVTIAVFMVLGCVLEGLPALVLLARSCSRSPRISGSTTSTTRWSS
jgi:TRAP-type C4-dicarboxylate transport system permease large subunit